MLSHLFHGKQASSMILVFSGRKVALDASVTIYQSLSEGIEDGSTFTNEEGETTRFALTVSQIFN